MSRFSREEIRRAMVLYGVTDRMWATKEHDLYRQVEEACLGGATCIQLREKNLSEDEFLAEAVKMKEICHRHNVPLIINDNVDIALKCGADGVHVGQKDMKAGDVRKFAGNDMIVGVSAKTVEQALEAEKNGADYLGVGAVFNCRWPRARSPSALHPAHVQAAHLHQECWRRYGHPGEATRTRRCRQLRRSGAGDPFFPRG